MSNNSTKNWTIMLSAYPPSPPTSATFQSFYEIAVKLSIDTGVKATHISISGKGYSSKWIKHGGIATQRLESSGFEGISGLGLCYSPAPSKAPAYDHITSIHIYYIDESNHFSVSVSYNTSIIAFQDDRFEIILMQMLELCSWSFGWGLVDSGQRAEFHAIGAATQHLSKEEKAQLNRWFKSKEEQRLAKPRDVYPVNVLHSNHLELMVGGKTLGEFIREVPGTRVEVIAGHTVWTMPPEMVDGLREELGAAGILIARG